MPSVQPDDTLRRLADYERLAGFFWIGLGILQIALLITAIAGIWNIIAGISRFPAARKIREGRADVPQDFEGLGGYVVIALINLIFGAFLGVILVGIDLFVRDQVLKNRHRFTVAPTVPAASSAANVPVHRRPGQAPVSQEDEPPRPTVTSAAVNLTPGKRTPRINWPLWIGLTAISAIVLAATWFAAH